jgi:hypothetical protein
MEMKCINAVKPAYNGIPWGLNIFPFQVGFHLTRVFLTKNVAQYIHHVFMIQIANQKFVEHVYMVTEQYTF